VLTDTGEVRLYRAHGKDPDFSRPPSFAAPSPSSTRAKIKKRSITLRFGDKSRGVQFSGRTEAPEVRSLGLLVLGPVGEALHLGKGISENRGAKQRRNAAIDAWSPVLRGDIPWSQIEPNV